MDYLAKAREGRRTAIEGHISGGNRGRSATVNYPVFKSSRSEVANIFKFD